MAAMLILFKDLRLTRWVSTLIRSEDARAHASASAARRRIPPARAEQRVGARGGGKGNRRRKTTNELSRIDTRAQESSHTACVSHGTRTRSSSFVRENETALAASASGRVVTFDRVSPRTIPIRAKGRATPRSEIASVHNVLT